MGHCQWLCWSLIFFFWFLASLLSTKCYYNDDGLRNRQSTCPSQGTSSGKGQAQQTASGERELVCNDQSGTVGAKKLPCHTSSSPPVDFLSVGWSSNANDLPEISVGVILAHLERRENVPTAGGSSSTVTSQSADLTQKPLNRGYNFFWSYVHGVEVACPDVSDAEKAFFCPCACCWAS